MRIKRRWEDKLLMIGGFGFSIALFLNVLQGPPPPISTCLMTGLILASFCVAYASLGLRLAFWSTVLTCILWFTLLIQRLVGG